MLKSFFDWAVENSIAADSWLILGKGPSFNKRVDYLKGSRLLGLNHVVRDQEVDIVHIIDLDVVDDLGERLLEQSGIVVMPWMPHIRNRPGRQGLEEIAGAHPVLSELERQRRLFYYNLSSGHRQKDGSPIVQVRYFSAEAAIGLLAMAGIRKIRTLGIDGGNTYSSVFSDLASKTLLANGRSSFNKQFEEFSKIIMQSNLDLAPADISSPIRIYVATQEEQMLSVKVLEYSIRKHASMSVEVIPIHLTDIKTPQPQDKKNFPRTPFSFQRFLIPEMAGYQGRAIYLDSDMQVFRDIKELWTLPFNGAQLLTVRESGNTGRRPQFSVMLLDCMALKWDINEIVRALDRGELSYETLMFEMRIASPISACIDPVWNTLEQYQSGETALVHYTDMATQPWVCASNPLGYLWVTDLLEAVEAGFISYDYIKEHVDKGYIRPSLMYQLDHALEDPLLLPRRARQLDRNFRAPYTNLAHYQTVSRRNRVWLIAVLRHFLLKTGFTGIFNKIHNRLRPY